jgi:hypothetical protein
VWPTVYIVRSAATDPLIVTVSMVQIRQMLVTVRERLVLVPVPMRCRSFIAGMLVEMMLVVGMQMLVLDRLVRVHVKMTLRKHEPSG